MLGDTGANALGAMLGAAAAASLPRRRRVAVLAGIIALTAASEKVSFTKVIQRTPPLHWLDMLGRGPCRQPDHQRPGQRGAAPVTRPGRDGPGEHRPGHAPACAEDDCQPPVTEAQETATEAGRAQNAGSVPQAGAGIARAAVLIGAITIVSNIVGLRPPAGLRPYGVRDLPGHRVRHRQPGAEHHLRHRPGRRPDQRADTGAGRPGGPAAGAGARHRPRRGRG